MRILIVLLLAFGALFAKITVHYDGSYSFLKMAEATMDYNNDGKAYFIKIRLKATGAAKLFSHNRKETIESRGQVLNGILVPDTYTRIKNDDKIIYIQTFRFDHDAKKVMRALDTEDKKTGKKTHGEHKFHYYAEEDILSFYYNFRHYFKNHKNQKSYHAAAIGGRDNDGRVDVAIAEGAKLKESKKLIENASSYYLLNAHTKILGSEKGEFFIGMQDDQVVKKVVLKDVIFFGDVTGKLVE